MQMIKAENLTKKFNSSAAVDNISFHIDRGEVFGLLGPNGAGKTTTIRMICCLISSTSGTATVGDYDISDRNNADKIRKMIGLVPDNVGLYDSLSAYANLQFYGRMYEFPEDQIKVNIEKYLKLLDLWDRKDQAVGTYSKGMKQKVAIARALIHDPEVLLMDEPTASLDPEASKVIRDIILDLKKENRTILLNTHNLYEAQLMCDRIGVLKTKLLAVDTPENLEKTASARKTEIILEEMNDKILSAVKATGPKSVAVEGNSLLVELADPEKETSVVVNAIVAAGGRVKYVNEKGASLEDVYIKLVRE